MELLWSDTAIRNGDSSVIVKLLSQMRKVLRLLLPES